MSTQTHFTHTEACTLIAHEAVSMLDSVETELPQCIKEFRTALEALCTIHKLGQDGEALLAWLDAEIDNANQFIADGTNLPYLIDTTRLDTAPDAVAQMDLVWILFDTAAMEECGPEQRRALLNTARTITEMCGMDDLLLATLKPNVTALAKGLQTELADIHAALQTASEQSSGPVEQQEVL